MQCRENSLPPRSVFGIACLANRIVLYGGEVDPSSKGHDGAGHFSSDVFIFSESVSLFTLTVLTCWQDRLSIAAF
jgi:hypothetical protein